MSRDQDPPDRKPLIALVDRANRAMQADMVRAAHAGGFLGARYSHNAVFGHLPGHQGARTVDLAERAGMTRQSMGEVVRDLVALGLVEMVPDPDDGRAKLVRFTEDGQVQAAAGYRYIRHLEQRFAEELGDDYEAARRVLDRVVAILEEEASRPEQTGVPTQARRA